MADSQTPSLFPLGAEIRGSPLQCRHGLERAHHCKERDATVCNNEKGVSNEVFSLTSIFPPGVNAKGQEVFLKDIWPTREEIQVVERQYVIPGMFKEVYQKIEVRPPTCPRSEGELVLCHLCRPEANVGKLQKGAGCLLPLQRTREVTPSHSSPVTHIFTDLRFPRRSQISQWPRRRPQVVCDSWPALRNSPFSDTCVLCQL